MGLLLIMTSGAVRLDLCLFSHFHLPQCPASRPTLQSRQPNNVAKVGATHVEVVLDPLELLRRVDRVGVDLLDGLLGIVHELKELGGPGDRM